MKHKKLVSILCILMLLLFVFLRCQKDIPTGVEEAIDQAILGTDLTKAAKTQHIPVTFSNEDGDTIIYHSLTTEYYQALPQGPTGIHWQVIRDIIDPETADAVSEHTVSGKDALLCTKGNRAYLCWTLTAEYSFVIEYTPSAVAEEEIFQMAEDLKLS